MPIIECHNIEKTYGSGTTAVHALRGINMRVNSGEFLAIIGASGSGKSTLLHILGGIEKPTSGTILVDGEDLSSLDATQAAIFRRRKVGLVYQFFNLIPTATVEKNILLPLLLDRKQPNGEFFAEIIESLGVSSKLQTYPSELSGGQQQRVALARSLIYRPKILLADEPTGNLDRRTSCEIVDMLKLANRKFNQTTIVITHDESVALEADRIITIDDGRLASDEKCR